MALATNLVSYWKADEASGNMADAVGSNTLTNENSATFAAGIIGNACALNGSNQRFTIGDNASLSITGKLTISCWIKLSSYSGSTAYRMVAKNNLANAASGNAYDINMNDNGANTLNIFISNGSTRTQKGVSFTPTVGVWYHIVAVYDTAGTVDFYINGVHQTQQTGLPTSIKDEASKFVIGATQNGASGFAHHFPGNIDEIGIWSRALNSTEVGQLYNGGAGLQYPFKTTTPVTKALAYAVTTTPAAITKGLQYCVVTTPSAATKGLEYAIKTTPAAITLGLQYVLGVPTDILRDLTYRVVTTPAAITKGLEYRVSNTPISLGLAYAVVQTTDITAGLQYAVKTVIGITKDLAYEILTEPSITKGLAYLVKRTTDITLGLAYRVETNPAITKGMEYTVLPHFEVFANGDRVTNQIKKLRIVQGTTKEATTASFVVDYYGDKWKPVGEDLIEAYQEGVKIFGGFITRPRRIVNRGRFVTYECECKDYTHRLDRKLVTSSYEGQTAYAIILDIVANFSGPGITTENVEDDAGTTIAQITFDNIAPSEAIQKLADTLSKDWYIDPEGDIHFFSKFAEHAPFDLSDDDGKHVFDSLELEDDFTQIRNSVLVEGGKEKSSTEETDTFVADGVQTSFSLSREYTDIAVTVDGSPVTVGAANLNTFDDHDVLYDFNLHSLLFPPSSPPGDTLQIVVTGKYYFPIAVRVREATSVALNGERQYLIQDKTLTSRADAIERAAADLQAYARQVTEGTFETLEPGLRAGQRIRLRSDLLELDQEFIIQRLTGNVQSPTTIVWNADIVSVKTYETIDLLAAIIKGRQVPTTTDAAVQTAERVDRGILVGRTITVRAASRVERGILVGRDTRHYIDDPPVWVAGPYTPTDIDDRQRVPKADRGALLGA